MSRALVATSLALSFLLLGACTDPDSVSGSGFERGIDADIWATHDAGAPTLRNLGLRGNAPLLIGRPQ
jgi:hypothetical protein